VPAACGGGSSSGGSSAGNGPDAASAPETEDWPLFDRDRDRDNTRFATQDEVNTDNVDELGEAWSTELGPDQLGGKQLPAGPALK
jgi:glucose dehydrogenase